MIPLYLLMMTACLVQTDDDLRCTRRDSTRAAWRAESASDVKRHGECTQYASEFF